ncbi:MAG: hypothetical protein LBC68_03700 [Prevotellaceae bacterium]|jgi:hypothetical protein|nr:hypothetical protein [Prevotellaceae bacterium]
MNKIVIIFILIACSITISAQTETETLPDTSKFLFDIKPATPINTNFNSLRNPFPTKLTINHNDVFLSLKDTIRQDSLNVLHEQKVNSDLLFVRSAYFSPDSKLFQLQKQDFGSFTDAELAEQLSSQIAKTYSEKYGLSEKPIKVPVLRFRIGGVSFGISFVGIGIGFLSKEEYMKARAEKRKKAYVY